MRSREAAAAILAAVKARRPAFLWGPPGIGKSSVVHKVAEELNCRLVDLRVTLLDPVDLRGLPKLSKETAVWCPPAFLPRDGSGILFLDELAQAPPLVQSACLQLVLDRKLGEYSQVAPDRRCPQILEGLIKIDFREILLIFRDP